MNFVIVDYLVALEAFQEVKIYLETGWDAKNANYHAKTATIWLSNHIRIGGLIGSVGKKNRQR